MVVSATWPTYPTIAKAARVEGIVELNVTTDGQRIVRVETLKSSPLLELAAQRDVSSWVFAPHRATSFQMAVAYELGDSEIIDPASCVRREGATISTNDLPRRVHVLGATGTICEPEIRIVGKRRTVSALAGKITCDCPGSTPLADIYVSISREPTNAERKKGLGEFERAMQTGPDGRFRFDNAPAGAYFVTISALTHSSGTYLAQLTNDGRTRAPLSISLRPLPAVIQYLKDHPPNQNPNWVGTDNRIPTYPLDAWKANIEGVVVLRMTPDRAPSVVEGDQILAASAMDYAKGWKASSKDKQPFDIRVVYKLVDADDVGGGPHVVLRLPREVEITAKRAPK